MNATLIINTVRELKKHFKLPYEITVIVDVEKETDIIGRTVSIYLDKDDDNWYYNLVYELFMLLLSEFIEHHRILIEIVKDAKLQSIMAELTVRKIETLCSDLTIMFCNVIPLESIMADYLMEGGDKNGL